MIMFPYMTKEKENRGGTRWIFFMSSRSGMTLIEMVVTMGLVSVLVLAMSEMSSFSARANKSGGAVAELNSNISSLIGALNTKRPYTGNYDDPNYSQSGGCNQIFYRMPFSTAVTSISPLYMNKVNPGPVLIQITAPNVPNNNVAITGVDLLPIDGPIDTRPDGSQSYIYDLRVQAIKTNVGGTVQVGGNTAYQKDVFLLLWANGNLFEGCS